MSTPTCNTCGTKFPGRERCKKCGANPTGKPEVEAKIAMLKKTLTPAATKNIKVIHEAIAEFGKAVTRVSENMAEDFKSVDPEELRKYERRMLRAKARSMRTTQQKVGHGSHRG